MREIVADATVLTTRELELSVLEAALPGEAPVAIGVVVQDPQTGEFGVRFRRDWSAFAGEEAEFLEALAEDFEGKLREYGAAEWIRQCEDSLSNTLRISDREPVIAADLDRALDRLYRKHVQPKVLPFVTHLPRFSAHVAAGKFLDDNEVEATDWVETPAGMRLDQGMFIVQITGRSMEPHIPDGSLCVFRAKVTGTRQGKWLLIEQRDVSESGGRYTVKQYQSEKVATEEGWRHEKIILKPLNRDFDDLDLEADPERFRVIGEFVRVLD